MGSLNTRKIRELTEPGRYADGGGLYLHIRKSGSRQWLLQSPAISNTLGWFGRLFNRQAMRSVHFIAFAWFTAVSTR